MWNNSYRTPTEHWQKTSDFPKDKKLSRTWVGQKNRDGTCTSGRELWRRKGFHTLGSPFTGGDGGWQGDASEPWRRAQQQECQRAKRKDSHTEDQCWPALTRPRGLYAHPPGLVGAGGWGSGFGGQIPGRGLGCLHEDSLKGAGVPELAGRESRKKSGPA